MWPEASFVGQYSHETSSPFEVTKFLPAITVVIDPKLGVGRLTTDADRVLTPLLTHAQVCTSWRVTTSEDPEPGSFRLAGPSGDHDVGSVRSASHDGKSWSVRMLRRSIESPAETRAHADENCVTTADAATQEVLIRAAAAMHADLFITDFPQLVVAPWRSNDTNVVTVEQALQFFGLHMRTAGEVLVPVGPMVWTMDTSSVHSQEALWLMSGVVSIADRLSYATGDTSGEGTRRASDLLYSAVTRIDHALACRDELLLDRPGMRLRGGEPALLLERLSLTLDGAFDSLARAIASSKGFTKDTRKKSFRAYAFRDQFRSLDPHAYEEFDERHGLSLLNVLSYLRNTIHEISIQPVKVSGVSARRGEKGARLPEDLQGEFLNAAHELGHADRWTRSAAGRLLHPYAIADDLVRLSIELIDAIVATVQWPVSSPVKKPKGTPSPEAFPSVEETRRSISHLYGIAHPRGIA